MTDLTWRFLPWVPADVFAHVSFVYLMAQGRVFLSLESASLPFYSEVADYLPIPKFCKKDIVRTIGILTKDERHRACQPRSQGSLLPVPAERENGNEVV